MSETEELIEDGTETIASTRPSRYIAERTFRQMVNGSTVNYEQGTVLDDEIVIATLLAQHAPITEVKDESDLGVCPHCGKSFSIRAQAGARELLGRARQLMAGFR